MAKIEESGVEVLGLGHKTVKIGTEGGNTIHCNHAVEATNIPLQKLSVVAELEYHRTYCIAVRVPKGLVEDCLIYDQADAYKYVRFTACNYEEDYLVIGGCDHKVGQEEPTGRFEELEAWVRERFTQAGRVDYAWSGQIQEPVDYIAFIGKNPGQSHTYIMTGDSGNGLTHFVLGGRLIADEIQQISNPWAKLYSPSRVASIVKNAGQMLQHFLYWETCRCNHKHTKTVWPIPYNYLYILITATDHLIIKNKKKKNNTRQESGRSTPRLPSDFLVKISAKLLTGILYLVYLFAERSNINAVYRADLARIPR